MTAYSVLFIFVIDAECQEEAEIKARQAYDRRRKPNAVIVLERFPVPADRSSDEGRPWQS